MHRIRCYGICLLLVLCVKQSAHAHDLSMNERVEAQKAIERVFWEHRIWPAENRQAKPPFEEVLSEARIRFEVEDYLRKSNALAMYWRRPLTAGQLQAEIDRMTRSTRQPQVLLDLFSALGNDPFLIAECLARPNLADRLVRNWFEKDERFRSGGDPQLDFGRFGDWWSEAREGISAVLQSSPAASYRLGPVAAGCSDDTWSPTMSEAPDARSGHTAVWTGSEMIVWGGSNLRTGGRYNPATDTWTPTSAGEYVPAARGNHAAVWTGKEMIVWGGWLNTNPNTPIYLNTGGRYDPATDTWAPTSTGLDVPEPRSIPTAVWTGTQMIVWGGNRGTPVKSGGRYDPSTDSWMATSTGIDERVGHTAVWTGNEMIIWGGRKLPGFLNNGGRYNPSTNEWIPTSTGTNVPSGRRSHTAVWTGSKMIVWGGFGPSDLQTGGSYDPSTDSWEPTSTGVNLPSARRDHAAIWTGAEMIVWGHSGLHWANGALYDPTADLWRPMSDTLIAISAATCSTVWTGSEMIAWGRLEFGGELNLVARYDPGANDWLPPSTNASVPEARHGHTAIWTGSEMVVWGGHTSESHLVTTGGGSYSPATDSWHRFDPVGEPQVRSGYAVVWTGRELIIWGGYGVGPFGGVYLNSGGRYDPVIDTWSPTSLGAGVPGVRANASGVWTGDEMIIWGGYDGDDRFDTGGRYDPLTNTWRPTGTGANLPGARSSHTAIWTGSEMIVWGGFDGMQLSTGGRYNAATDEWVATGLGAGLPPARSGHTVVWTGSEMIVWGGSGSGGQRHDTGARYKPATDSWASTSTAGVPAGRQSFAAVWTGSEMIVWGGLNTTFAPYVDTGGRYDPASDSWTTTSTASAPSGRYSHTAVWSDSGMIVWGGYPATSTGGLYCAASSCEVRTWFRDADADGHGLSSDQVLACSQPEAHVPTDGDCDDRNPSIHPGAADASCDGVDQNCSGVADEEYVSQTTTCGTGACERTGTTSCVAGAVVDSCSPGSPSPEICDGIDNDCDGAVDNLVPPPYLPHLLIDQPQIGQTRLTWSPVGTATAYDVVRGSLNALFATLGDFRLATTHCLADDVQTTTLQDPDPAHCGGGFWYLVRAVSDKGPGTYDWPSCFQEGSRDAEIQESTASCP